MAASWKTNFFIDPHIQPLWHFIWKFCQVIRTSVQILFIKVDAYVTTILFWFWGTLPVSLGYHYKNHTQRGCPYISAVFFQMNSCTLVLKLEKDHYLPVFLFLLVLLEFCWFIPGFRLTPRHTIHKSFNSTYIYYICLSHIYRTSFFFCSSWLLRPSPPPPTTKFSPTAPWTRTLASRSLTKAWAVNLVLKSMGHLDGSLPKEM